MRPASRCVLRLRPLAVPVAVTVLLGGGVSMAATTTRPPLKQPAKRTATVAPRFSPRKKVDRAAAKKPTGLKTAKPVAKPAAKPTAARVTGHQYATTAVQLRTGPGASYHGPTVPRGTRLAATDRTSNGWRELSYRGERRWVLGKYLSSSKPAAQKKSTAVSADSSRNSGGVSSGSTCPSGSSVERGLTPDAIKVHRAICHAFPQVKAYGGVRADSLPEHPSGRAVDAMISSSGTGRVIAGWVRSHARELGVSQVIFAQRIWTVQRSGEGWRSIPDRGSATANHDDHVHISVYGHSATG